MFGFWRGIRFALAAAIMMGIGPAAAQENLEAGKSAMQLFASDCAICHKTPHGLAKSVGMFGLSAFLRQHYTASRESASALAGYLEAVASAPPAPVRKRARKPAVPQPKERAKADDKAATDSKTGDGKPAESKPAEAKATEAKAAADKPADVKPASAPAAKPENKPEKTN